MLGGNLFEASLASECFLSKDAGGAEHGQAAVLEFLELELGKLLGVVLEGVEVGPKAQVAGGLVLRVLLANGQLDDANGGDDLEPRGAGQLPNGLDAGGDLAVVQGVVKLGEPQAKHAKHGQAAVLELHGTVAVEGTLVLILDGNGLEA